MCTRIRLDSGLGYRKKVSTSALVTCYESHLCVNANGNGDGAFMIRSYLRNSDMRRVYEQKIRHRTKDNTAVVFASAVAVDANGCLKPVLLYETPSGEKDGRLGMEEVKGDCDLYQFMQRGYADALVASHKVLGALIGANNKAPETMFVVPSNETNTLFWCHVTDGDSDACSSSSDGSRNNSCLWCKNRSDGEINWDGKVFSSSDWILRALKHASGGEHSKFWRTTGTTVVEDLDARILSASEATARILSCIAISATNSLLSGDAGMCDSSGYYLENHKRKLQVLVRKVLSSAYELRSGDRSCASVASKILSDYLDTCTASKNVPLFPQEDITVTPGSKRPRWKYGKNTNPLEYNSRLSSVSNKRMRPNVKKQFQPASSSSTNVLNENVSCGNASCGTGNRSDRTSESVKAVQDAILNFTVRSDAKTVYDDIIERLALVVWDAFDYSKPCNIRSKRFTHWSEFMSQHSKVQGFVNPEPCAQCLKSMIRFRSSYAFLSGNSLESSIFGRKQMIRFQREHERRSFGAFDRQSVEGIATRFPYSEVIACIPVTPVHDAYTSDIPTTRVNEAVQRSMNSCSFRTRNIGTGHCVSTVTLPSKNTQVQLSHGSLSLLGHRMLTLRRCERMGPRRRIYSRTPLSMQASSLQTRSWVHPGSGLVDSEEAICVWSEVMPMFGPRSNRIVTVTDYSRIVYLMKRKLRDLRYYLDEFLGRCGTLTCIVLDYISGGTTVPVNCGSIRKSLYGRFSASDDTRSVRFSSGASVASVFAQGFALMHHRTTFMFDLLFSANEGRHLRYKRDCAYLVALDAWIHCQRRHHESTQCCRMPPYERSLYLPPFHPLRGISRATFEDLTRVFGREGSNRDKRTGFVAPEGVTWDATSEFLFRYHNNNESIQDVIGNVF